MMGKTILFFSSFSIIYLKSLMQDQKEDLTMANNNYQNNQGQDNGEARASRRDMNTFLCRCRIASDATYRPGGVDENGGQAESVLFFRLACNDGYLRRDKTNAVSYISCRLRGKRADALHQYLTKGTRVTMEARLVTWSTKDAQGQYEDHYILDVDELWFESQAQQGQVSQQMPAQNEASQYAPQPSMMGQPAMPTPTQPYAQQQMPIQNAAPQYAPQASMPTPAPTQSMMGQPQAAPNPFAFEENPFENPMFSVGN